MTPQKRSIWPARRGRIESGLTLLELMIVVAIVGILATLAVYMFTSERDKAKVSSEVSAMFSEFKVKQEQYLLENGTYLSTGADDREMWPPAPSGPSSQTALRDSDGELPPEWAALRMNPDKSAVHCAYVAIAGTTDPSSGVAAPSPGPTASSDFDYEAPSGDWYYLLAECDMDGDSSTNARYFARHDREGIVQQNDGN